MSENRFEYKPPNWKVQWIWVQFCLKEKFILFGQVFLFVLLAAALTALFGAVGFLIGFAAGAWSGPGAFFTAIGGAFTGVVTAWNLAVLIASPVLALTIIGTSFLFYRMKVPISYELEDISPLRKSLSDGLTSTFSRTPPPLNLTPTKNQSVLGVDANQSLGSPEVETRNPCADPPRGSSPTLHSK